MIQSKFKPDKILERLLLEADRQGSVEIVVEYKDGFEEVSAIKEHIGVGIADLKSSDVEACALREQLNAIGKKGKTIHADAETFHVKVSTYESFGETAYRMKIRKL